MTAAVPARSPFLIAHDGDAAAAHGDDHKALVDHRLHDGQLHDLHRLRRSDDAPPAAARVLLDGIALLLLQTLGVRLGIERADGLGRAEEGGVLAVHDHLRDDRGDRGCGCRARAAPWPGPAGCGSRSCPGSSLPHTSNGMAGVMSTECSFCSTMRPTCGPLPCASTTWYPPSMMSAMYLAVFSTTASCASAVAGPLPSCNALPPKAMTSFSMTAPPESVFIRWDFPPRLRRTARPYPFTLASRAARVNRKTGRISYIMQDGENRLAGLPAQNGRGSARRAILGRNDEFLGSLTFIWSRRSARMPFTARAARSARRLRAALRPLRGGKALCRIQKRMQHRVFVRIGGGRKD